MITIVLLNTVFHSIGSATIGSGNYQSQPILTNSFKPITPMTIGGGLKTDYLLPLQFYTPVNNELQGVFHGLNTAVIGYGQYQLRPILTMGFKSLKPANIGTGVTTSFQLPLQFYCSINNELQGVCHGLYSATIGKGNYQAWTPSDTTGGSTVIVTNFTYQFWS